MTYKNNIHAAIFKTFVVQSPYRLSNRFLAAVYFLSADKDLWMKGKKGIKGKQIDFDSIDKSNLGCYAYTLFGLAMDCYKGGNHVSIYDIGDLYLFSDNTVALIVSAIGILRGGYRFIGIEKAFE